jgi:hypothetical protein
MGPLDLVSGLVRCGSAAPAGGSSQTHSGPPEQTSGSTQQIGADRQHRVDSVSGSSEDAVVCLGPAEHRPDGYASKQPTTDLCQPVPARCGLRSRRHVLAVGSNGRVHLSPVADDTGRAEQATTSQRLSANVGSAKMAKQRVVPSSSDKSVRLPSSSASSSRSTRPPNQRPVARLPRITGSARVQSVFNKAIERGFSEAVSTAIALGHQRDSTKRIYDSKWQLYSVWCDQRKVHPINAPITVVADFLWFLFTDKRLGSSAIDGYRSAINSVWKLIGRSLESDAMVKNLLKYFRVQRP